MQATEAARAYLAEVRPEANSPQGMKYWAEHGRGADGVLDAVLLAEKLPEAIVSGRDGVLMWALTRTPIDVARLLELARTCEGRPRLREPLLHLVDMEVQALIGLRTAAGYSSPIRWGVDGHVESFALLAALVEWVGWLIRLDHPEHLAGWDEFLREFGTVRAATWSVIGAHDAVRRIVSAPVAAEIAGVTDRTLRRWATRGRLARRRAKYHHEEVVGFDEVEVAAVKNPAVGKKPHVRRGVSA